MKHALVINPYITDFKLYDEWMHPLGLYFLIDTLRRCGFTVNYFNCQNRILTRKYGTGCLEFTELPKPDLYQHINRKYKLYGIPQAEFEQYLQTGIKPDLICFGSMMTYWAPGVIKTVEIVRKVFPDIPIVIGGIAARLIPEFFRKNIENVYVNRLPDIDGFPETNDNFNNSETSLLPGLKAHLLNYPLPHGPLLLSFGCPMHCSYCASSVLQPNYYTRSAEIVLNEIDFMVQNFGIEDFAFYDDALLLNKEGVLLPFLQNIKERGYKLRFHTPNGLHLRYLTQDLCERMFEAGFKTLRFGYESGSTRYKKDTNSKIGQSELKSNIALIKKNAPADLDIGIYVMGGLEGQTPQELLEEMDYLAGLGIKVKPVFISPVPGTILFEHYAKKYPEIRTDPLWHNDTFFITCLPGWDQESIEAVRVKARELNTSLQYQ